MIYKLLIKSISSKSYSVIIESSINFSHIIKYIVNKKVLIVTNILIKKLYLNKLLMSFPKNLNYEICILEDGEYYKSQKSLDKIILTLIKNKFTRNSTLLIALGGGVIGDLTGFAAAIYQRGVDFIQIPTTIISQVDSSIGGKTAINHKCGKNMIGSFYQPKFVYIAVEFYKTLPKREYISGMAEIIKYAFISKDFYLWLKLNKKKILAKDIFTLMEMIKRSCQIKAWIISSDEKETLGIRSILNFGHTFSHAIEKCQHYKGLNHGESLAIGMACAIDFSYFLTMINYKKAQKFKNFIISFNLSINFPKNINKYKYLNAILIDKKNINNKLTFILINDIGNLKLIKKHKKYLEIFLKSYKIL